MAALDSMETPPPALTALSEDEQLFQATAEACGTTGGLAFQFQSRNRGKAVGSKTPRVKNTISWQRLNSASVSGSTSTQCSPAAALMRPMRLSGMNREYCASNQATQRRTSFWKRSAAEGSCDRKFTRQ